MENSQLLINLANLADRDGHSVSYYYNNDSKMQKFLFAHGLIPAEEKKEGVSDLREISFDNQSVHDKRMTDRGFFVTKKLVENTQGTQECTFQAAERLLISISNLFDNDLKVKLLGLTDQEKNSITEKTKLSNAVMQDNKTFARYILEQAEKTLNNLYLKKEANGNYANAVLKNSIQYDWQEGQEKHITIPESIGRVFMLIDKLEMPYEAKQELLVSLIIAKSKNGELEGYIEEIRSKLGDDSITLEKLANRTSCHALFNKLAAEDKDGKVVQLFGNISDGLDIKEIWKEQQIFKLVKAIYVASTTYGPENPACLVGTWQQIIGSSAEINSAFEEAYSKHMEKRTAELSLSSYITEENIKSFAEAVANELIGIVNEKASLKKALYELSLSILDIAKPSEITLEQQKILAKINTIFVEQIQKYLPNYNVNNLPTAETYKILINAITNSGPMVAFGLQYLQQHDTPPQIQTQDPVYKLDSTDNPTGNGTKYTDKDSYWNEYSKVAMKDMLDLRLKFAGVEVDKAIVIRTMSLVKEPLRLSCRI